MNKKILFNGNNEAYLGGLTGQAYLPDNWTTCPFDALNHSERSAKRHGSKMAILAYTKGPDNKFRVMDTAVGCRSCDVDWYIMRTPLCSREEKDRVVKLYSESDLANFVNEFFDEEHKESLGAMKYYDKIFPGKTIGTGLKLIQEST